jgi:pyridinium-3,5-bisthiocarboxylic acid mononucleotide nickel chelatase
MSDAPSHSPDASNQREDAVTTVPPPFVFEEDDGWKQLADVPLHAHFDCFSGAAGDMMLAACLDAAGTGADGERLQAHVQNSLNRGLPQLAGEFDIVSRRVWRGRGSIAARHVKVNSAYGHRSAPVPAPRSDADLAPSDALHLHDDSHSHTHTHSHAHAHSHTHADDMADSNVQASSTDDHPPVVHDHHGQQQQQQQQHEAGPFRNLPEIRAMLESDDAAQWIPLWVRQTSIQVFTQLALAEAAVHCAESADSVHFHEVGAVDSIVDTVGTLLALHCLGVKTVSCSRLPLGEGTVKTEHGLLPVPAPATLCLMIGMCTTKGPPGATGELVTPTGAALLQVLTRNHHVCPIGESPPLTLRKIGVGAGTKDFESHPNVMRMLIGERSPVDAAAAAAQQSSSLSSSAGESEATSSALATDSSSVG